MEATVPTLSSYVGASLRIGAPDVVGSLAMFPLFGPTPVLLYQSFAQGRAAGVTIKELGGMASVRDLVVDNPTAMPLLLFEGEEVLGARQNRTVDVSVLVPARSSLKVPVSCVEEGRWDGARHREPFAPAPQAAHPSLRRLKSAQVAERISAGAEARADQRAVWQAVDEKLEALAAAAPTGAMHDGFVERRHELDEMCGGMAMHDGQTGMLVAIGGELTVLDRVSRPDVLESLFGPLVQGYALDALGVQEAEPPSLDEAKEFVARILAAPINERDGIGAGREVRLSAGEIAGAGVASGTELVQLSVFSCDGESGRTQAQSGRVRRPSLRRRLSENLSSQAAGAAWEPDHRPIPSAALVLARNAFGLALGVLGSDESSDRGVQRVVGPKGQPLILDAYRAEKLYAGALSGARRLRR
jgi:hypothetical protein